MKYCYAILVVVATAIGSPIVLGEQPREPEKKVVKITLHPMPAPRPALKYQLLPPYLKQRPGNAAVWWNRIPAEQTAFFSEFQKTGGSWEKIEKWMEIPLGGPREKEVRAKDPEIARTALALYGQMAEAARFESCDWELPFREGNVISMLLPEVQQMRTYGRLLAAKAHLEIAEGQYAEAIETLQTGLTASQHVARGQFLVNALVGSSIGSLMTTQMEQMVQQPDAPNLYWALTALPQPLIDYRPAFEMERNFCILQFPDLRDVDKKDLAPEQWTKLLQKIIAELLDLTKLVGGGPQLSPALDPSAVAAGLAIAGYPMAKEYLVKHSHRREDVEAMPVARVILLHTVTVYQELADDQFKLMFLPLVECEQRRGQVERELREIGQRHSEIIPIASLLLPAIGAAKQAEGRMPWSVAHLRIFEALRIYAASHDGKLPERLSDITEVPIPRNPFDDKPFDYRRDGNRAMLTAEHGPRNFPWKYEITMQSKGGSR